MAKQKGLTAIYILGQSIGMACFGLFLFCSLNEFNYGRFHSNADQLYRVYRWTEPMHGDEAEGDTGYPRGKVFFFKRLPWNFLPLLGMGSMMVGLSDFEAVPAIVMAIDF